MVPLSKIVYGSDCYTLPEGFYSSAKQGKQALGKALAVLVEDGMIGEADAREAGEMILYRTSSELYRI